MIKYFVNAIDVKLEIRLERRSPGASGYDLMANMGSERILHPMEIWSVPTGIHLSMPIGVEAQVRSRSGLSRAGVIVINAPGTVDSDYRGEIYATLINLGKKEFQINPGDRIAQLVFAPVAGVGGEWSIRTQPPMRVTDLLELGETERGSGGHGSTGR